MQYYCAVTKNDKILVRGHKKRCNISAAVTKNDAILVRVHKKRYNISARSQKTMQY
jgi:hypothetical protein